MQGQNIICFAKDWTEDPTSNNHVMKMLAKNNKVLWLNSIAMRSPSLTSGGDFRRIFRKLAGFFKGAKRAEENLWVYTPIVLPFPHNKIATALNRVILRAMLAVLRRRLGMKEFQLWTFLPNAVEYVGSLGETMVVYYCIDEWSQFSYLDGAKMATLEEELCRRADVVFATARSLAESKRRFNPMTKLALHGVDYNHFSRSMNPDVEVAPEIAALEGPVIGFFGLIHEWLDLELIAETAERHPEWNIVLIGKSHVDLNRLERIPNVHLLGRKPYADLPRYCKGFDVGIIPFAVNELTVHVNPIKLREYLCAGLPVVSTDLPEVVYFQDLCTVAGDHDSFIVGIENELARATPEARRTRSSQMEAETWERKVEDIGRYVMEAKAARSRTEPSAVPV